MGRKDGSRQSFAVRTDRCLASACSRSAIKKKHLVCLLPSVHHDTLDRRAGSFCHFNTISMSFISIRRSFFIAMYQSFLVSSAHNQISYL